MDQKVTVDALIQCYGIGQNYPDVTDGFDVALGDLIIRCIATSPESMLAINPNVNLSSDVKL